MSSSRWSKRVTLPSEVRQYKTEKLPHFGGLKVLILNGAFVSDVVALFAKAGCKMAKSLDEAELVVFTGGSDIGPDLYGDKNVNCFGTNPSRDSFEREVYAKALERGIPMFGICRGFQFIHAMCGGKLWQHVNGHGGPHDIVDIVRGVKLNVSSIHHQMVQEHPDFTIVAVTPEPVASQFNSAKESITMKDRSASDDHPLEIEAGYWAKQKCIGVQGHPELYKAFPNFASWSLDILYEFLYDLDIEKRKTEVGTSFGHNNPPNFLSNSAKAN